MTPQHIIEAALLSSRRPMPVREIRRLFDDRLSAKSVKEHLAELQAFWEDRGMRLVELSDGWRFQTASELGPRFLRLDEEKPPRYSRAAMETLAIVAYTQPVTRAGVASVRGVNSDSSINSLVEKGLVREVGTEDAPGNPVLYGTTRGFLEKFGLRSPADLPDLADFAPDAETRRLITERLSATRKDAVVSDEQARTMARALMGEDFEVDDGEAMLSDEELAQGTDAAAEVLELRDELKTWQEKAGDSLDLSEVLARLDLLAEALEATARSDDPKRFEKRSRRVLSEIIPLAYVEGSVYSHDEALRAPPVPMLRLIDELASLSEHERNAALVSLRRAVNRLKASTARALEAARA